MVNIHIIAQMPNGKIIDPLFPQYDEVKNKITAKDVKPVYKILEGDEEREWFLKIHKSAPRELKENMERTGLSKDAIAKAFYDEPEYLSCYWNSWAYKHFHPEAQIKVCWFGFASKKKNKVCWLFDGDTSGQYVVQKFK
jgi:hypothetical protein